MHSSSEAGGTQLIDIPLVDTDAHVSEPADLWTSRMPARFADQAPRPVWVEEHGEDWWQVGDTLIECVSRHAFAGHDEFPPSYPKSLADADPASYDSKARLERMDGYGLYAQTLYPNIIAFSTLEFMKLGDEFAFAAIRAWNDFLAEWTEPDPNRLIPLMMLPFWNIEDSVAEMTRAKELGHRGIVFAAHTERGGFPPIWDDHWNPIYGAAQEMGLSINFHVGNLMPSAKAHQEHWQRPIDDNTAVTSQYMMNNAAAVADVACKGVCHKFPNLNFVSVESGVGWIPYLMENLDWHWKNYGGHLAYPDRELPSFYIRRQVYGTFWFETDTARHAAELIPDNIMFETDFPHMTSLSPGPVSPARAPREMVQDTVKDLDIATVRKIFYENAARVYNLPPLTA